MPAIKTTARTITKTHLAIATFTLAASLVLAFMAIPRMPNSTSLSLVRDPMRTGKKQLNLLVFIDDNSFTISNEELKNFIMFTDKLFYERMKVRLVIMPGGVWHIRIADRSASPSTNTEINRTLISILSSNRELTLQANGFILFTNASYQTRTYGGATWPIQPNDQIEDIDNYCNTLAITNTMRTLYGIEVDWARIYGGWCGYDLEGRYISDVSIPNGQCRNQVGIPCVIRFGRPMCGNLVDEYTASDPRLMPAGTVIHEITHYFDDPDEFALQHYGSPSCTIYPSIDFACPSEGFECYFGSCPSSYLRLRRAKNLCDEASGR